MTSGLVWAFRIDVNGRPTGRFPQRLSIDLIADGSKFACFKVKQGETAAEAFNEIVASPQPGYFVQFGLDDEAKAVAHRKGRAAQAQIEGGECGAD